MIPVQGFEGATVAVLGLGRSGLATARALLVGGANPVCWDDQPQARERAEAVAALQHLLDDGALIREAVRRHHRVCVAHGARGEGVAAAGRVARGWWRGRRK